MEMPQKSAILAIFVLLLNPFASFGQDESDITWFESFFKGNQNPASVEKNLSAAIMRVDQAREIDDSKNEARALKTLGLIHLTDLHDNEKAMDDFIGSLAIEDSLGLDAERVLTYLAIAKVFEVVGDYYKSAQFLEQSLNLNTDKRNINTVALILNSLGKVNAARGRIADAFENYKQVLRYREDIEKRFEAEALYNLGQLYTLQGKYDEALKRHKRALAISRAEKDQLREALTLNEIGEVYALMKNEAKSLANHQVALEIRQALEDKAGMAESYNHIGWWYFRQHHSDSAIANGMRALENGREAQAQEQIFQSYELLSQAYKGRKDYENALTYKELSLAIREFIQNEKQERQVLETQNRYVVEKKETEIQNLEALRADREREIAAHKKFKNILSVVVALVCIIALLVFVLYLVKRRANRILKVAKEEIQKHNEKLQDLNSTKDKFFSIISHDLKGPLNSLTSFATLLINHTENMTKEEIRMLARDLDKSVRNLFVLLENLLEWSRSQTGNIDFTGELFDLKDILELNKNLLESQAQNKQISIVMDHMESCPVKLHKQSINTVVRNLISNAIKFCREGGTIRLSIAKTGNQLSVSVADNGIGMTKTVMNKLFRLDQKHSTRGTANEKGTGLGLILCKEFIEKNGGKMSVESEPEKGSVFTFSFPLQAVFQPEARIPEPASF